MRRRRNPWKGKFNIAGYRNWIVLSGALVGGYFLYKRVIAPMLVAEKLEPVSKPLPKPQAAAPGTAPAPDLNGPVVRKGVLAATKSTICISQKTAGMVYMKIIRTRPDGYQEFRPTRNGHFTRRMLCQGNKKWAEVKPA